MSINHTAANIDITETTPLLKNPKFHYREINSRRPKYRGKIN